LTYYVAVSHERSLPARYSKCVGESYSLQAPRGALPTQRLPVHRHHRRRRSGEPFSRSKGLSAREGFKPVDRRSDGAPREVEAERRFRGSAATVGRLGLPGLTYVVESIDSCVFGEAPSDVLPWISLSGTKLLLSVGLRRDVDDVEGSRSPLLVLHEPFFARYSYSGHFPATIVS